MSSSESGGEDAKNAPSRMPFVVLSFNFFNFYLIAKLNKRKNLVI